MNTFYLFLVLPIQTFFLPLFGCVGVFFFLYCCCCFLNTPKRAFFFRSGKQKKNKNFNSYPNSNTNGTEKKTRRKKKCCSLGEEVEGKGDRKWGGGWKKNYVIFFFFCRVSESVICVVVIVVEKKNLTTIPPSCRGVGRVFGDIHRAQSSSGRKKIGITFGWVRFVWIVWWIIRMYSKRKEQYSEGVVGWMMMVGDGGWFVFGYMEFHFFLSFLSHFSEFCVCLHLCDSNVEQHSSVGRQIGWQRERKKKQAGKKCYIQGGDCTEKKKV